MLRDSEVTKVGLPESSVDVWECYGSHEEHKYTWDLRENDNKILPNASEQIDSSIRNCSVHLFQWLGGVKLT